VNHDPVGAAEPASSRPGAWASPPRPGLYLRHPACLEHDPRLLSPGHPDTPERLVVLEQALAERDWLGWERREPAPATEEDLELVHERTHIDAIAALCARGGGPIDPDTNVGPASFDAALHAAGCATEMARALIAGEADVAFCGVRPAGHHAEPARAMGFCLFDNIAVAAAAAISRMGVSRVLILDWDVHAGNGTAEIFRHRRDVLFACIHEHGLFPGTGPLKDAGSGGGEGYTINLPVPGGSGEPLWLSLLDEIVLPVARTYRPELILVSCGFDAHERDPLARCVLETDSFVAMAGRVRELARSLPAPAGLVLEGGYNIGVLAECTCATLPALVDGPSPRAAGGVPAAHEARLLELAREHVSRYWAL
jgi:acetoin utilization deacetylase AcuC-like enzyme